MGYWSEKMISDIEGPSLIELDKNVCQDCVTDPALSVLVSKNLNSEKCDYCGDIGESGNIAAPFDVILSRIYDSIRTEYGDAQDVNTPWVDGDWLAPEIYIDEIVSEYDPGWGAKFLQDVCDCLNVNIRWVKHSQDDWVLSDPSDVLMYGWEAFKKQVIEKTRYLFLSEPIDESQDGHPDYIPINQMLDELGNICISEGMVRVVPAGTEFYRVRHASHGVTFSTFSELGVPPIGKASSGRMNPAGIPYLYIAQDAETACREVLTWTNLTDWYVAKYRLKKDIKIIDFLEAPEPPSFFEPDNYNSRHVCCFIRNLAHDFTKPVEKDSKEHVDYVPTQIVSEYFRYRFKDSAGDGVFGLKYPSVRKDGGVNFALFSSCNDELQEVLESVSVEEHSTKGRNFMEKKS